MNIDIKSRYLKVSLLKEIDMNVFLKILVNV